MHMRRKMRSYCFCGVSGQLICLASRIVAKSLHKKAGTHNHIASGHDANCGTPTKRRGNSRKFPLLIPRRNTNYKDLSSKLNLREPKLFCSTQIFNHFSIRTYSESTLSHLFHSNLEALESSFRNLIVILVPHLSLPISISDHATSQFFYFIMNLCSSDISI